MKAIQDFSENFELTDVWRVFNPETKRYTWCQWQPDIQCRLGFFLVSQSSICNVTQADIIPGFKTNHSVITLSLSLHSIPRGNGFWNLNTSLLKGTSYLEEIKATIRQAVNEYEDDDSVNAVLLWEMVKLKIGEKSISYTASKKRQIQRSRAGKVNCLFGRTIDNTSGNGPRTRISEKELTS